ncbi:MAG: hypothetical protein ACP5KF_06385 [Sulfurihydrogenibium sp.]|jgi:hypothetical protein
MRKEQLEILIYDTETFVYFQQKKIDKIIKERDIISTSESVFIFKNFSESLFKLSELFSRVNEIENHSTIRDICELSLHTIGWIIFTLPSLEIHTPLFPENFKIKDIDIIDFLAQSMINIENLSDDIKSLKWFSTDITQDLKKASMFFGYLSSISQKGGQYS